MLWCLRRNEREVQAVHTGADIGEMLAEKETQLRQEIEEAPLAVSCYIAELEQALDRQAEMRQRNTDLYKMCIDECNDLRECLQNCQDERKKVLPLIKKQAEQIKALNGEVWVHKQSADQIAKEAHRLAEQLKAKDEAIEAALRIKTLWLCPTPGDGPEVEEECRALAAMAVRLEQALKGEPCKSEQ